MSAYGQRNDPRAKDIPWGYFGIAPNTDCEPKATQRRVRCVPFVWLQPVWRMDF